MSSTPEKHPEVHDAVDLLIDYHGDPERAENYLLLALSLVRQRKVKEARS